MYLRVDRWRGKWMIQRSQFFFGGGWLGLDFIKASSIKPVVSLLQGPGWEDNWVFLFAEKNSFREKKTLNSFQKWFIFKSFVKSFPCTEIGSTINTLLLRG